MFTQGRSKLARIRKVGAGSFIGSHKHYVDMKTGMGLFGSLRGFFSRIFKKAAPVVKDAVKKYVESGKPRQILNEAAAKGTKKLNETITQNFGPSDTRSGIIDRLGKFGADAVSSKGQELASKLLGKGIRSGTEKKFANHSRIQGLISGKGIAKL